MFWNCKMSYTQITKKREDSFDTSELWKRSGDCLHRVTEFPSHCSAEGKEILLDLSWNID